MKKMRIKSKSDIVLDEGNVKFSKKGGNKKNIYYSSLYNLSILSISCFNENLL